MKNMDSSLIGTGSFFLGTALYEKCTCVVVIRDKSNVRPRESTAKNAAYKMAGGMTFDVCL